MSKERTPTSYLDDDWGMTPPGGTNASGIDGLDTPGRYEQGNGKQHPSPK